MMGGLTGGAVVMGRAVFTGGTVVMGGMTVGMADVVVMGMCGVLQGTSSR